jgi:hypothetical protein
MSQRSHPHQGGEELELLSKEAGARWIVSIDERPENRDWVLEIDSPYVYLTLQLGDLSILARAVELLNSGLAQQVPGSKHPFLPHRDAIALGRFGDATVHLLRDNEDFPRCFLLVQPNTECALRITVDAENMLAFAKALSRALSD